MSTIGIYSTPVLMTRPNSLQLVNEENITNIIIVKIYYINFCVLYQAIIYIIYVINEYCKL